LDNLENRFDHLETRFDKLEDRFDNLESRYDKLVARVANLEVDVSGLKQSFSDMEAGISARFVKIDGYFDTLFRQMERNRQEALLFNKRLADLENRVEILESKSVT